MLVEDGGLLLMRIVLEGNQVIGLIKDLRTTMQETLYKITYSMTSLIRYIRLFQSSSMRITNLLHLNRMWLKWVSKMNIKNIKEILKFLAEGIAFLLCLAAIYFLVMFGCVMVDSCYYYYVPGGGV